MTDESTLLSDQVFQLNTFLWALEELPEELGQGEVQPVLRRAATTSARSGGASSCRAMRSRSLR